MSEFGYIFLNMKRNLVLASILVAALSVSTAAVAGAASYPPSLKTVKFDSTAFAIGNPVIPVYTPTVLKTKTTVIATTLKNPVRFLIGNLTPGDVVSSTAKGPDGKVVNLPKIIVNANGTLDSTAIGFKKAGKYVITYKLPNGTTRTVTITVK